jgi:hypothetical protein
MENRFKTYKKVSNGLFFPTLVVIPKFQVFVPSGVGTEERYTIGFLLHIFALRYVFGYSVLQDFRSVYTVRYRAVSGEKNVIPVCFPVGWYMKFPEFHPFHSRRTVKLYLFADIVGKILQFSFHISPGILVLFGDFSRFQYPGASATLLVFRMRTSCALYHILPPKPQKSILPEWQKRTSWNRCDTIIHCNPLISTPFSFFMPLRLNGTYI